MTWGQFANLGTSMADCEKCSYSAGEVALLIGLSVVLVMVVFSGVFLYERYFPTSKVRGESENDGGTAHDA